MAEKQASVEILRVDFIDLKEQLTTGLQALLESRDVSLDVRRDVREYMADVTKGISRIETSVSQLTADRLQMEESQFDPLTHMDPREHGHETLAGLHAEIRQDEVARKQEMHAPTEQAAEMTGALDFLWQDHPAYLPKVETVEDLADKVAALSPEDRLNRFHEITRRREENSYLVECPDGELRAWMHMPLEDRLHSMANDAAFCCVTFDEFSSAAGALGDKDALLDASLRVAFGSAREMAAIQRLFPYEGRMESTLLDQVKDTLLDVQPSVERQQEREDIERGGR